MAQIGHKLQSNELTAYWKLKENNPDSLQEWRVWRALQMNEIWSMMHHYTDPKWNVDKAGWATEKVRD